MSNFLPYLWAFFIILLGHNSYAQVSIKIIVNSKAITSNDIQERKNLLQLTGARGNLEQKARDDLVNGVLQRQEAQRLGVSIPQEQVQRQLNTIAKRVRLSKEKFKQILTARGSSIDNFAKRIRAQMLWSKLVNRRYKGGLVREQDITAEMIERGLAKTNLKTIEYDLQQIILVIPAKSSTAWKAKKKREAQNIQKSFKSCESDIRRIKQKKGFVVKNYGTRVETEFPNQYRKALEKTKVGHVAGPFTSVMGIEMIAVCGKREIKSAESKRAQIKLELGKEQTKVLARRYLRDLKRNALIEYK